MVFPLGATLPQVKAYEAQQLVETGAGEVDMVINIGVLKDRDFVKTSTGFSIGGATPADVALMRST